MKVTYHSAEERVREIAEDAQSSRRPVKHVTVNEPDWDELYAELPDDALRAQADEQGFMVVHGLKLYKEIDG